MARFGFNILDTEITLDFMNFNEKPFSDFLGPLEERRKSDMEIVLFRDHEGNVLRGAKSGSPKGKIMQAPNGFLFSETYNKGERKTLCFFEKGISLDYILDHSINRSLFAYHDVLDMIFLHTACATFAGEAYLFIAPSGGGKSTICSIAQEEGMNILDDEICVIKRKDCRFHAFNFPSFSPYKDILKAGEIKGVFLLEKSDVNRAMPISGIEAIQRTLPEATTGHSGIMEGEKKAEYHKHVFEFLGSMFDVINFKLLKFNKQLNILSCIKEI